MLTGPRRDLISRLMRESLELATTCLGDLSAYYRVTMVGQTYLMCFRVTMDFLDAAMAVSKGQTKKDL